jgi:ketopantoate reductase
MLSSISIIGAAGQTGQLFVKEIAGKIKNIRIDAVVRSSQKSELIKRFPDSVNVVSDLRVSLKNKPEVIILATPNPTTEVLEIIAEEVKKPTTIVLPQNGVSVVPEAQRIFKKKNLSYIYLVRASLFTTVSLSKDGNAVYNPDKLRIALAPVQDFPIEINALSLKSFFEKAGFRVSIFDNYRSMELTKLIVNGLGSTAAITGFTSRDTFNDERLFELEMRALKDRMTIMRAEGFQFAKIPWKNIWLLPTLSMMPISFLRRGQGLIAEFIARGRENTSPGAARKIMEGRATELSYYHKPFLELGKLHGLTSPVDEAILEVIREHERGIINLSSLIKEQRRDILLKAYETSFQKPYVCNNFFPEN